MKLEWKGHFDAAHLLSNHSGGCKNLHGHRWEVEVEIINKVDKKTGMIIDFGDLKKIVNRFDHATVLMSNKKNKKIIDLLRELGMKHVVLTCEPTAENLTKILHDIFYDELKLRNVLVRVFESPNASAEYDTVRDKWGV